MANYHVAPGSRKGWSVKKAGATRGVSATTQHAAEKLAKRLAGKSGGGEVIIHGKDGKIVDKDTIAPARDPFPPRDKKH